MSERREATPAEIEEFFTLVAQNLPTWCIECGRDINGSDHGPGATLNPDCAYCRQRAATGTVSRKENDPQ